MKALAPVLMTLSLATLASACPSAAPRPEARDQEVRVDVSEPVLLTTSGALELHVRDGRILEIVPAAAPGESARMRQIRTLEDLRTVYAEATGNALPSENPAGVLQVNGWVGLECVRLGQVCGTPPEGAPRAMILIRFE